MKIMWPGVQEVQPRRCVSLWRFGWGSKRLDFVDQRDTFRVRDHVMKIAPGFLTGPYRSAMWLAMRKASTAFSNRSELQSVRAWKLLLLLPRMLLRKPSRVCSVSKGKFQERFDAFARGDWGSLLSQSEEAAKSAAAIRQRSQRTRVDSVEQRAERAQSLAELGELSSARLALDGASCAPRNEQTLRALRDPRRRLVALREDLPDEVQSHQPVVPFELDHEAVLQNLRSARRGAAPGPSGMTSEHLRPLLEHDGDGVLLCELADQFARASVPEEIVDALRMGRMTAVQKPSGGVRGIVVGESFRRSVSRTIAQQCALLWRKPQHHSNTHSRPDLVGNVWRTRCKR